MYIYIHAHRYTGSVNLTQQFLNSCFYKLWTFHCYVGLLEGTCILRTHLRVVCVCVQVEHVDTNIYIHIYFIFIYAYTYKQYTYESIIEHMQQPDPSLNHESSFPCLTTQVRVSLIHAELGFAGLIRVPALC